MQYTDFLYAKAAEECGELAQAAIKCMLFGEQSTNPSVTNSVTNQQALCNELTDLVAILSLLNEQLDPENSEFYVIDDERLGVKQSKVKTMYSSICHNRMEEKCIHM